MKVQQEFTLDRPVDDVWAFFHDVPAVAECIPGAEYLGLKESGAHSGRMTMKVGPFQAAFEGEAVAEYNDADHTVHMEGKGVDRRGGSRGKMAMGCAVVEAEGKSRVTVDADIQLSGAIAQFGRTGIVQEVANVLIADFVRNFEQAMAAKGSPAAAEQTASPDAPETVAPAAAPQAPSAPPQANAPIGGMRLLWLSLRGWLRSLFKGQT